MADNDTLNLTELRYLTERLNATVGSKSPGTHGDNVFEMVSSISLVLMLMI